ncbi:MAG TPA: DPP IV N-terminal domain-containing protein, partial [Rubricoccaceae bacterium]
MFVLTVSRRTPALVALVLLSLSAAAQTPALRPATSAGTASARARLTLDNLFAGPEFFGTAFEGGRWADAGAVLRSLDTDTEAGTTSLVELNLTTNQRRTLIDGARLVRPDGEGLLAVEDYAYSADGTKALLFTDSERVWRLNTKGLYYVVDLASGRVTPVADRSKGLQMFAKFSPDGRQVAFVRDRNLFVTDLASGQERALTTNGAAGTIINGTFDWVYEEEFGLRDGFQWSPDGQRIAFYQLDESATRDFQITNFQTLYPEYQAFRYPKAGEANAEIHVGVIDVATGETRFLDTDTWGSGGAEHEYIAGMGWTPALADGGSDVWMLRLNRNQNHVDLMYADPAGTAARTVLSEENDSYIEVETGFSDVATGTITYLRDGQHFVWRSDRDGYGHLYLYTNDGTFVRQITQGAWDVTNFHGVDERAGVAYVTTTAENSRERHLYRVPLTGGTPVKLTQGAGWHDVDVSRDFAYFTDTYSTQTMPPVTSLVRTTGERVSVLDDNAALIERLAAYDLPTPEFMTVPAADGTPL